jgi:hypothetical protein
LFDKNLNPFSAARETEIIRRYLKLGDVIVAMYEPYDGDHFVVFINSDANIEFQEDAFRMLLEHHEQRRGVPKVITVASMNQVSQIRDEIKRLENMIADIILRGAISFSSKRKLKKMM